MTDELKLPSLRILFKYGRGDVGISICRNRLEMEIDVLPIPNPSVDTRFPGFGMGG